MEQQIRDRFGAVVRTIRRQGADWGRSNEGAGRSVQVEFVSADPNGLLHVGHGRGAAIGDSLSRLLEWTGWQVTREYYINDTTSSSQMMNFGRSLLVRYQQAFGREVPMPEDGYEGEFVTEIAAAIVARDGDRYLAYPDHEAVRLFTEMALAEMLAQQRSDLTRLGVCFDCWFSEESLHTSGAVAETLDLLKASGNAYEKDGALWLRSTVYGDDKDRVLVRATGAPTYLAADAAYHRGKFARGFDRVLDIWGPDYYGYVVRTQAAMAALGLDPQRLEILIHQSVRVLKGGEVVRMSKRAGDVIPLADLVDEVGSDAARFFFLMCEAGSRLDFDVDLARRESIENPVYCVQSAHARLCGVLREARDAGGCLPAVDAEPVFSGCEGEGELAGKLSEFPEVVARSAALRQAHLLAAYTREIAEATHRFCDACEAPGQGTTSAAGGARLALADAARIVLANALGLMGISAPEQMAEAA